MSIQTRSGVQQRTVRVLVAAQVLGGAAIGVGAAVSPLLAKEILGDDTFAGVAFAALTFGSALAAVPLSWVMSRRGRRPGLVRGYFAATAGAGGRRDRRGDRVVPVAARRDGPDGVGHRSGLDSPADVDTMFEQLTHAGHIGSLNPYDAPWGQRYATVLDPDGNIVDLFAPLPS